MASSSPGKAKIWSGDKLIVMIDDDGVPRDRPQPSAANVVEDPLLGSLMRLHSTHLRRV